MSGSCTVREVPIEAGHKKLVCISKPIEEAVTCGCDSSVGSFAISEVFPHGRLIKSNLGSDSDSKSDSDLERLGFRVPGEWRRYPNEN